MKYRLIAIDLDGTLLDPHGRISRQNLDAVAKARDTGALIVPCTGRSWAEARGPIAQLKDAGRDDHDTGIFVGGAIVTRLTDGSTINSADMDGTLAVDLVEHLYHGPEAILVFRDANRAKHDYLITGHGKLSANSRWWFEHTDVRIHIQNPITPDHLTHTLRIGVVTTTKRMHVIAASLKPRFDGRITFQSFAGVQKPEDPDSMHVLEIFAPGVDKWRGIKHLAETHNIPVNQIAAIGDEINDVAMLKNAGLSVAMANAVPESKAVAKQHTLSNHEHGVAHALNKILAGEW
jgi:5-amino-6-(5-phospho-D-ribitylamino)uracil phosphatase